MSRSQGRLTGKHIQTADMKNACYCTLLAAALLVSCQTAPKGPAAASAPAPNPATAAADSASADQVPANTVLWVRLRKDLDSTRLKAGDHFTAEVSSPVVLNGKAVIPQGAPVQGVVVEAHTAAQPGHTGSLGLQLQSVRLGLRSFGLQTVTVSLQSPQVRTGSSGNAEADRMARHEGDAFVPQNENLQFILTSPVSLH